MAIEKKLYTVEEFEKFANSRENADRRFELINGEIVEKVPTEEHGIIASNIVGYVWNFNRQHNLGHLTIEARHQMPDEKYNARMPDVSFILDTNRSPVKRGSVPQMPDLAIEIQSPDDSPDQMCEKAKYYLQNGTQLVWLFYPKTRTVEACTWNAEKDEMDVKTIDINGRLDGGDVLPGFTVVVREIFPK